MSELKKVTKSLVDSESPSRQSYKSDLGDLRSAYKNGWNKNKARSRLNYSKGIKEETELDEAREPSHIAGTRLVSKHEGKDGHHAEVRYNKDWQEYSVHHYHNGKHLGEGPVSYHGDGKEGREDAENAAEHAVKNFKVKGGKLMSEEAGELTEVSKETLKNYLGKNKEQIDATVKRGKVSNATKALRAKRESGAELAKAKLTKILTKEREKERAKDKALVDDVHSHFQKEAPKILASHSYSKIHSANDHSVWHKGHDNGHSTLVRINHNPNKHEYSNYGSHFSMHDTNGSGTLMGHNYMVNSSNRMSPDEHKKEMMNSFEGRIISNNRDHRNLHESLEESLHEGRGQKGKARHKDYDDEWENEKKGRKTNKNRFRDARKEKESRFDEEVKQIDEISKKTLGSYINEAQKRYSSSYQFTHHPGDEESEKKLADLKASIKGTGKRVVLQGRLGKDSPHAQEYKDKAKFKRNHRYIQGGHAYQRISNKHAKHFDVYTYDRKRLTKEDLDSVYDEDLGEGLILSVSEDGIAEVVFENTVEKMDLNEAQKRYSSSYQFTHHPGDEESEKKLADLKASIKGTGKRVVLQGRLGKDSPHAQEYKDKAKFKRNHRYIQGGHAYQRISNKHAKHFDVYTYDRKS